MALSSNQLEEIVDMCAHDQALQAARTEARRIFFGDDDPRPVHYLEGMGDQVSRDRRFLGWFMFSYHLPDGRTPVEVIAEHLPKGSRDELLQAIGGHRYVLATVSTIIPSGTVFLELEDESIEVRHRPWARLFSRGHAVAAHLLPVRKGIWLPGPGWVEVPIAMGPNMRNHLRQFQPDPVEIERLLQARAGSGSAATSESGPPIGLDEAVGQMNAMAQQLGRPELRMSAAEWTELVQKYLYALDTTAFFEEVSRRVGESASVDELQQVLGLASDIWNTTPQPDRGGLTASEIQRLSHLRPDE